MNADKLQICMVAACPAMIGPLKTCELKRSKIDEDIVLPNETSFFFRLD